jgi:carbon storage regulator
MLILSRRTNESLRIGTDIIITVVGFSGNQIRLGITAPANVVIDREEVHQRKLSEQVPSLSVVAPTAPLTLRGRRARSRIAGRRRTTFGGE